MLFFFQPQLASGQHYLDDEEYQHCIKVLRHQTGDEIGLFDGKGLKVLARITAISGKRCDFEVIHEEILSHKGFYSHIAIAPTKNTDRMEWFVEKACELGVDEITFLETSHSERSKIRTERLEKKAVSALKQSQSGFLTRINPLTKFAPFLKTIPDDYSRFIGVVADGLPYFSTVLTPGASNLVLIGPEGDFSPQEAEAATAAGFVKISLGKSTLRTETAGLMASHFINMINKY